MQLTMMDFKKFSFVFSAFFILGSCSENQSHILSGFALGTTYTIKYNAPNPVNELDTQVDSLFLKSIDPYLPTCLHRIFLKSIGEILV